MCHYTSGKKKCQIITEYSVLEVCLLICTQPSHQKINLTKNNLNRVSPFFGLGTEIEHSMDMNLMYKDFLTKLIEKYLTG